MKTRSFVLFAGATLLTSCASVKHSELNTKIQVSDKIITHQRAQLIKQTEGMGFG
ncbi:MAG: hypothetical protein GQ581_04775, partial [Methyloprofundus sp.]|nr:hypothetical protein [Methyloprofundus sp.]